MKTGDIKKQLIVESGIIAAGLVLLGGLIWGLSSLSDDAAQKNAVLQAQVNNVNAETNSLYEKYSKVESNIPLYQEAVDKLRQDKLKISREKVRDLFNQFNSRYYLSGFHVTMSGVDTLIGPKFKYKNYGMISSSVTVNFDGISDEDIYGMLNAMQQELPGSARVTKFGLGRLGPVSGDALRAITQSGLASLVRGEIDFSWYGIEPEEPGDANAQTPKP